MLPSTVRMRKAENSVVVRDGDSRKRKRKPHQMSRFRSLRGEEQGPPSRTRASLKRKLQQDVPVPRPPLDHSTNTTDKHWGKNKQNEEEELKGGDQPSVAPSAQPLPSKKVLELIIDTLQRRDTYEIFAEPVDPQEVEDYYEIIKEPMDFGTMRAKLHEGMYTSLEQFEHDVYLISGNAMHFNSSSTIFFRQARAIHELAKKVFHVLRNDPKNFVAGFSGTRRRSCKRDKAEAKDPSSPLFSTSVRSRNGNEGASTSKGGALCSLLGPLVFTCFGEVPEFGTTPTHPKQREIDFFCEAKRTSSDEMDKRLSYKHQEPQMKFSKVLTPVNQQQLSYGESLMSFVKDLGPTAQMVAKRKLKGLFGDTKTSYQGPTSNDFNTLPSTSQIPKGLLGDTKTSHQAPRSNECHPLPSTSQIPTSLPSKRTRPNSISEINTNINTNTLFDNLSRKLFNPRPIGHLIDLIKTDEKEEEEEDNKGKARANNSKKKGNGRANSSTKKEKARVDGREKPKPNEATQVQETNELAYSWHTKPISQPSEHGSLNQISRVEPQLSRFGFDLLFLKSSLGKMKFASENETNINANTRDDHLSLQL